MLIVSHQQTVQPTNQPAKLQIRGRTQHTQPIQAARTDKHADTQTLHTQNPTTPGDLDVRCLGCWLTHVFRPKNVAHRNLSCHRISHLTSPLQRWCILFFMSCVLTLSVCTKQCRPTFPKSDVQTDARHDQSARLLQHTAVALHSPFLGQRKRSHQAEQQWFLCPP